MKKGSSKSRRHRADAGCGGLEFEVRRTQRLATVAMLRTGRTPLQVVAVADSAAVVAEEAIRNAAARQPPRPPLACRADCAWCCHKMVGTTVPEVIRIAHFLRDNLSAEEFAAARERVIRVDDQRRALKQDRWAAARLPCPLLVEERCSAYPVRPVTCRGFNSSDARQCERSVTVRDAVAIPVYAPQHRLATFVLDGLRAGLDEAGLKGELLELTAALRIALTVPEAVGRWLNGEPVFAPAKFP